MTLFLIVSYVYPNGLNIRPVEFANDNIFTDVVQLLYRHDTPTNVLPSIHVFNSLCIHLALANSKMLRQDPLAEMGISDSRRSPSSPQRYS